MSQRDETRIDRDRVSELFAAVVEARPEDQQALLLAAARDAPEVAAEVGSLLGAHHGRGILDGDLDPKKALRLVETEGGSPLPGRVGPYRIARELGRGGMGVVYLAERAEGGFDQRVALKLVKRGMDSEAILARFLQERQILARLEHPSIARLLDGGLTADSQPYFAMEYVEGQPITHYCTQANLDLEGRLALFAAVCSAVQYAHGRLVVHRDLKPSNVLVAGDGSVKLVDFGIAKVLDPETGGAGTTGLTALGVRALTPEYASPEQIRGEPVTVTSDVYALGLLLYELLAGTSPYPSPLTTPEAVQRAVCETEALAPSIAIQRNVAIQRNGDKTTQNAGFAKYLRGDLDRVVLKALAKEPERRYPSAEALVEDLYRFRDGLPVRAHSAGWRYRARKFVSRHRAGVAAATAVVLALILGLTGTAWQASTAARERDRARLESAKLLATQAYLVGLFRSADPATEGGDDVTAKDLVVRGLDRLDNELSAQPEVQLEMLGVLSQVSLELGEYDQAERLLKRSLELAESLHGESHRVIADTLVRLGRLLNERGDWINAEAVLQRSYAVYLGLRDEDRATQMGVLTQLGDSLSRQGKLQRSVAIQQQALAANRELFGNNSPDVAAILNNLGNALNRAGDYGAAEKALVESMAIQRQLHGEEHAHLATQMVNLGNILSDKGDYQEAESLIRQGVAMERRIRGDEHPRLATKLHNHASLLNLLGRFDEAAALHREVLVLLRQSMGETSPYYAATLSSLADDLGKGGHFTEAMSLLDQAEPLLLTAVGREHSFYSEHLMRHASSLHLQGLDRQATPLIDESIRIARDSDRPVRLSTALDERATIRFTLGALEGAADDFREALAIQRERLPASHPDIATTLTGLGWTLIAEGEASEAADVLREAVSLATNLLPPDHWRRAEADAALGAALVAIGQRDEGEPILRAAHGRLVAARGPDHPATHRTARHLDPSG